jgi:large subunit ribosomal protein L29
MKPSELRAKSDADLNKELLELLKEQFNLRMAHSTQQLSNTGKLKDTRRAIARARTILHERGSDKKAVTK